MIPILSTALAGWKFARRLKRAVKEGKDVVAAVGVVRAKYMDLPEDVKLAWKEIDEFFEAVEEIF